MITPYKQFAAAYGTGTYGSSTYQSTSSNPAGNGTLPATGTNIMFGLVGGVLLIVIAIALFVAARKNRK